MIFFKFGYIKTCPYANWHRFWTAQCFLKTLFAYGAVATELLDVGGYFSICSITLHDGIDADHGA